MILACICGGLIEFIIFGIASFVAPLLTIWNMNRRGNFAPNPVKLKSALAYVMTILYNWSHQTPIRNNMQSTKYVVSKQAEEFRIYPKNKQNETIPLTISRRFFTLTHTSGDTVTFKNYLWRGQWLWNDSRRKGRAVKI